MLLALISDIHGNDLAFAACVAEAERLGAGGVVLLGDLVGYGPEPEAAVVRAAELAARGAISLKGNHDAAVAAADPRMNPVAATAIAWTRARLSGRASAYLAGLPLTHETDDLLFVHADASEPSRWNYVTDPLAAQRSLLATTARVTFCGHTHMPRLYGLSATGRLVSHTPVTDVPIPLAGQRQWLAVIGSAGQPRDGNPAAAFATYDTARRELTYRRAPYDIETVAAKIRAAGLPEVLAIRLLLGH